MEQKRRVRLQDVARLASVSAMTASNVLNNRPGASASTRERVQDAARQLGYVPNRAARGLAGGRTHMVGVIIHDLTVQWATEVVTGVADVLSEAGLELLVSATYQDASRELERVQLLQDGLVDGLIMVSPVLEDSTLDLLTSSASPVVVVDPRRTDVPLPSVSVRNYDGAREAVEHLIRSGHRSIAIVSGDPSFDSSRERLRGYTDALVLHGIEPRSELVKQGGYTQAGGRDGTLALLRLPDPPTAIFATSDIAAIGAIDAARAAGLRVPDDLSVIGFDDIPSSANQFPALTTVRQPLREMGRTGTRMLLQQLDNSSAATESRVLETQLVIRQSSQTPSRVANKHE